MELFCSFMRRGCHWLTIICFICGILPLITHGIWKCQGIWALLAASVVFFLLQKQALWTRIFGHHWQWMEAAIYVLIIAGLTLGLVLTGMIAKYAFFNNPPKDADTTIVVLGCKISGDRPTIMLRQRLDSAYRALEKDPELMCVVSGGQGDDEQYPESHVMRNYLISRGIAPERVVEENASRNTRENLQNSMEIIREKGWSETITIVTSGYHQCRAGMQAKKLGIDFYNRYSMTSFYLVPAYVVREWMGILHFWIFGGT